MSILSIGITNQLLILLLFSVANMNEAQHTTRQLESPIRIPSYERLQDIAQNSDYFYNETIKAVSLWDRFIIWLQRLLSRWYDIEPVQVLLKVVSVIAFILVLLLLINQMSKGDLKNAIYRRRNRSFLHFQQHVSTLTPDTLDALLKEAISKKNFEHAVRYLYHKALFLLREKGLIKWSKEKTNHEYLYELSGHPTIVPFEQLTYFHEHVDYGSFAIDEMRFAIIQKIFGDFRQAIDKKT